MKASQNFRKIKSLVGEVTEEELRHVDCFIGENMGVFMPLTGQCYYAATPFHKHPTYMFLLPFNEQTILIMEEQEINLRPGTLYALAPNIKHHEKILAEIPRYMAVFIDKSVVEDSLEKYDAPKTGAFTGEGVKVQGRLIERLKYFILECDNDLPGNKEVVTGLETVICHQLIRNLLAVSYANEQITDRLEINKAINFMQANFSSDLTINRIAKEANMSTSHFSRVFKNETGQTVMNYLNEIRIKAAKKMLLTEKKSITDIAHRCGFNSLSYMSACFSDYTGLSPSEYRSMFRE